MKAFISMPLKPQTPLIELGVEETTPLIEFLSDSTDRAWHQFLDVLPILWEVPDVVVVEPLDTCHQALLISPRPP